MNTIFVTIFQGIEARTVLRSDIYTRLLAKPNTRLVFFVKSSEQLSYYSKEFSHPRVMYEVVSDLKRVTFWESFFSNLKFFLIKTNTLDLRRQMSLKETNNYVRYFFGYFVNLVLANSFVRKVSRFLDYYLVEDGIFSNYFDKYKPSTVFLAHLFDDLEISLLREAKHRGVKSIGLVNSWDKLTARNAIRILPDKLLVPNQVTKKEALEYTDMSDRNIIATGMPNYDWHVNYKPLSRSDFFSKKGLDFSKKLIVYAPMGKTFSDSDWGVVDFLSLSIKSGSINNAQLLVRFPPNDFIDDDEFKKRPELVHDIPGIRFSKQRGVNWDMSFEDIKGLTDTLANTDLFICYASSMSIDAAIFDKPVINIDFEFTQGSNLSKTPTYFYKMTHYQKAVKTGGINLPKSKEDLISAINKYLENPAIDKAGRARLVNEQCWRLDGEAGVRIANHILNVGQDNASL